MPPTCPAPGTTRVPSYSASSQVAARNGNRASPDPPTPARWQGLSAALYLGFSEKQELGRLALLATGTGRVCGTPLLTLG